MNKFYPSAALRGLFTGVFTVLLITITLAGPGTGRTGGRGLFSQAPTVGVTGFDTTSAGGASIYINFVPAPDDEIFNLRSSGLDFTPHTTNATTDITMLITPSAGYGSPTAGETVNRYLHAARANTNGGMQSFGFASDDGSAFNLGSLATFVTTVPAGQSATVTITAYRLGSPVGTAVTYTTSTTTWTNSSPTDFTGIDSVLVTAVDNSTGVIGGINIDAIDILLPPPPPFIVNSPALSAATVGVAYTSETFTASNGTAPYTFAVTSGALPAGMTLSSAGVLSGTPTAGGTFNFSVTATDATSATSAADAVSLTVNAPTITVTPATLSDGTYQTAYTSVTFSASGGTSPYTYSATGLPPGMSVTSAGVLSGTPTAAGTYSVTVTATDHSTGTGPYQQNKTYTLVIDKVPLTITVNNATKAYGAALPAFSVTYSGFAGSDNAGSLTTGATFSTAATAASPVNTYAITASGAVDPNYAITYVAGTLTITPVALTVTANNQTMTYGGALPVLTVSYSGFVNGDTQASLTTAATASTTATSASPVNTYAITASGAVDPNYTITYAAGTLTIGQAALTVTADNQSMTYGETLPVLTVSYSGFVNGDTQASLTTAATASTAAVSSSSVGNYAITASGAVDPNYTITYVAGTLHIGQAPLTITANNQSMIYGGALPVLTVSYSGFVNGDNATSLLGPPEPATGATSTSSAGSYDITVSSAVDPNYAITYVAGTLTIGQAPLTITANNQAMIYGGALPVLTVSYSGFVNGDNETSLLGPPEPTTSATSASPAGTYAITVSDAVDPNYAITYVPGTLTIGQAALTITADNQSMTYGSAVPALTVTYSGFVNGDTQASLTTAATASTPATSASPANTYTITPSGAVDPNYTITYANGTLTIGQAALTITADNQSTTYGSALPALTVTYSGFVNGDTQASLTTAATASTTATSASPAGGYTITPSGAVDANYTITYVNGTLTIGKAPLTITADNQSSTYGSALPALAVTYSGFVNGDTQASLTTAATASTPATAASPANTYTITPSGAVDPNYAITYVDGTLTIGQATLTITADNQSMTYGSAVPTLTASYSGFVNGDNVASLTVLPAITTPATSASPANTYTIMPSGAVDANYAITYVQGTLTIGQAPLTITANNQSMGYGSAVPTLTASYSGFVNGDNASSLTTAPTLSTTATSASPINTYPITASGAVDPNYAITYVSGTLTIGQAILTVTADNQSMTYGGALPTLTVTYSGFVNGDNAASLTTPATVSTTATSASPVNTYAITASGVVDPNYTIVYAPGTLTVGKAVLTFTATDQSIMYGFDYGTEAIGLAVPGYVNVTGFVNGDNFTAISTEPTLSTAVIQTTPVGTYPITVGGGTAANYTFAYVPGTVTVTRAPATIIADPQTITYGSAIPTLTFTIGGLQNSDNNSVLTTQPTLTTTATSASPVGNYPITPSGGAADNYTFNYSAGNLAINPAALTITADNQSMSYGSAVPPLTVSYSGFVNGDDAASLTTAPTVTTTGTSSSSIGNYPITASGAVDPNYTITYVTGTLSIGKPVLTITANNASATYGSALPALTVTYSGFVNGDNASSLTVPPIVTTTAVTGAPAGAYTLTPSGAVDPNYTILYVNGTLTIGQAPLTVTADNQSTTYGSALPALTVTYSGFVNGDTQASLTTAATASTTATSASPAGSYAITPGGAADANYAITYVNGTLTIGQAALTITADNQSTTYGSAQPALTVTYSGFVNGDTQASLTTAATASTTASTTATAASPAGSYPITPGGAVDANYAITYVNGTLTIGQAALTITADNQSMAYGSALPALTVTYSGFVNGDTQASLTTAATASTTATSASPVGSYPITPGGAVDANYAITYVNGTLTIGKAALTITADNQSTTYGSALPALTVTYSGFVNGDTQASLTTAATASTTATSASPAGSYTITPGGAADANYAITYVNGTLTIGQAALTITANNQSTTYGSALPALTVTYSGFVNGDTQASLTTAATASTTATAASPAGSYPITPGGAVDANYAITYVAGTLTIGQAALTITAGNESMTYGSAVPTLTASYSGFVNGDNAASLTTAPTLSTTATSASPVNTYPITASGAVDPNYSITYVAGTLTIGQAALTVTAADASRYQGQPNPPLTVSYSGFVNGDNSSVLTTQATATTTATIASPAGMYPITASGAADPNYTFTYVSGTLTVIQALPNVITFGALPVETYGDADFAIAATATSGLPVTFTSEDNTIATVYQNASGTWFVHIVSAGTVTIAATQAASQGYAAATEVDQTLVINKASQAILFPNPFITVPTTGSTVTLGASASSGLPITYTVSDPTIATVSGNQLTIVGSGTVTVTASQAGNTDYTAATPVTITLQTFDRNGFVSGIGVFPNPVHSTLHIRMSQDYQITKIVIFDLGGKIVLGEDDFTTNASDIPLNVSSLMPGIYILRVVCIRDHQLVYPNFKIEVQ